MNFPTPQIAPRHGIGLVRLLRKLKPLLVVGFLLVAPQYGLADDTEWEYKVVILQGLTAGGAIERDADGVHVDALRTSALNLLASRGWEVVAVLGAVTTDHSVYLRRKNKNRRE